MNIYLTTPQETNDELHEQYCYYYGPDSQRGSGTAHGMSKIHRDRYYMVWTLVLWLMFSVTATSSLGDNRQVKSQACGCTKSNKGGHNSESSEASIINTEDTTKDWPFGTKNIDFSDQSPVNIDEYATERLTLKKLRFSDFESFENARINVTNTGSTVRITFTDDTAVIPTISGGPLLDSDYILEQMHFHWGENEKGSEHEINGNRLAMEFHMVYYKKEYETLEKALNSLKGVCVIGVLGEISSKDNDDLKPFIDVLKEVGNVDQYVIKTFKDEFSWLKDIFEYITKMYHTYHGSLTTSPFSGSVNWIISPKPIKISSKQLDEFRNLHSSDDSYILANNRKLFNLEKRKVYRVLK